MACDTQPEPNQTLSQRKDQVKKAIGLLAQMLAAGQVRAKVGPQGAIAFEGWSGAARANVSDACAYRLLMVTGSALAKAKIAQAEAVAGRSVNRKALHAGHHSHDGGHTWSSHKH